jgi:hypothetical protein
LNADDKGFAATLQAVTPSLAGITRCKDAAVSLIKKGSQDQLLKVFGFE